MNNAPHHGQHVDVAVIGSGFGGLGCALRLAERGASVALYEALNYPGGCASTFTRHRCRFESGATLFSGFGEGQLMRRWIDDHAMPVQMHFIDPPVVLRTPDFTLEIPNDRAAFVDRLCAMPGAPEQALRRFFTDQGRIADTLWSLFSDPALLPPFGPGGFMAHLRRSPRYLPLLRVIGRPLGAVMARYGVADFDPLRITLDALCQITVQAGVQAAEAPFAMATMDYTFRGTGHVEGGVGVLARAITDTLTDLGAQVRMPDRVHCITREGDRWRVKSRKGELTAQVVVANMLPQDVRALAGIEQGSHRTLDRLSERVEEGWGAVMLYRVVEPDAPVRPEAHHIEIVQDPAAPFIHGNHLFCSVSDVAEDRAPEGRRTVTVSTHVRLAELLAMSADDQRVHVESIQQHMRDGLDRFAPELSGEAVHREMPASPRTFERFTRRHGGYVGGIPRRAGLINYTGLFPKPVQPGLYMVGDTMFPGQSTLATALGGYKLAEHLMKKGVGSRALT
ncbi:MAG: phytoene desaturase family protein [Bradymonadia bacterium]